MNTSPQDSLTAYALWLQERGLRHPPVRPASAPRAATVHVAPEAASPSVKVVFVGDGLETGDARALLDKMIVAMKLASIDVAVLAPAADLAERLGAAAPKAVVTMGIAAGSLAEGAWRTVATHHPAELLKTPALKRQTWSDLQVVMEHLGA